MRRVVLRIGSIVSLLLITMSLTGCMMVFTILGKETYTINSAGILDGPAKVEITITGLVPRWPDKVKYEISGSVSDIMLSAMEIDDLADKISLDMYDRLEFDSCSGSSSAGNPFWLVKEMDMPPIMEWFGPAGSTTAALGPYEWALSEVITGEFYDAIITEFTRQCTEELSDTTSVGVKLEGLMTTNMGRTVATLDCDFMIDP